MNYRNCLDKRSIFRLIETLNSINDCGDGVSDALLSPAVDALNEKYSVVILSDRKYIDCSDALNILSGGLNALDASGKYREEPQRHREQLEAIESIKKFLDSISML